jgi:hypothetical protein
MLLEVGDRVRVTNNDCPFYAWEGTVDCLVNDLTISVYPRGKVFVGNIVFVRLDGRNSMDVNIPPNAFLEHELVKIDVFE